MIVNGKEYPLWSQFVDRQLEFVGGTLQDLGEMDQMIETKITGISLTPNGGDSAFFRVNGARFDCGFDVQHGGITAGEEGWITFGGYGGHTWRIKEQETEE